MNKDKKQMCLGQQYVLDEQGRNVGFPAKMKLALNIGNKDIEPGIYGIVSIPKKDQLTTEKYVILPHNEVVCEPVYYVKDGIAVKVEPFGLAESEFQHRFNGSDDVPIEKVKELVKELSLILSKLTVGERFGLYM